jgi:hypothetical protein
MSRLTHLPWRRLIFYGSAVTLFSIFVFSLTPITSPLPPYTGPHEVGILDLETEVERRVINEAVLKETGQKAFEVGGLLSVTFLLMRLCCFIVVNCINSTFLTLISYTHAFMSQKQLPITLKSLHPNSYLTAPSSQP